MKLSALMLLLLAVVCGCENTKGQNRHKPNHHQISEQSSHRLPLNK